MDGHKDLRYYKAEFERLADEAQAFGISAVIVLCEDNPIERSETISWFTRGGRIRALGMTHHTLTELQSGK